MITKENYYEVVKGLDFKDLPEKFRDAHDYVNMATQNGESWQAYDESAIVKTTIDDYFSQLQKYLDEKKEGSENRDDVEEEKELPLQTESHIQKKKKPGRKPRVIETKSERPEQETEKKKKFPEPDQVERISDEVRFIKRYALMDGKKIKPEQIRNFINALQKAILEKRIRKTSEYADEIRYIQERLINWFNTVRKAKIVGINPDVLEKFRSIVGSQKILLSTAYLKRYIGMQGKYLDKEKAERLRVLISNALDKNKIPGNDPYYERINAVLESLKKFTKTAKKNETLVVHPAVLNGIQKALDGIEDTQQNLGKQQGYQEPEKMQPDTPPANLVSSVDFEQMMFPTLGFMGKWYNLIGDPVKGFIAMIFGKPKMGKSYLAIDFAGYLAEYFGKTLYVSREEGFGGTLQQKIREKNVAHPNLYIAHEIPKDLSTFDFVIFDSATRLNLEPYHIRNFKEQYPGTSFIYVFQAIKDGNFRGSQEFEHDVDIVIDVYAKGKARQYGRFNQGGEMEIFDNDPPKEWPMAA